MVMEKEIAVIIRLRVHVYIQLDVPYQSSYFMSNEARLSIRCLHWLLL